MLGNPRYGTLGLVALPYFLLFELLGPVFGLLGVPATLLAWWTSSLSLAYVLAFLFVAFLLGMVLSVEALALEEFSFRRHRRSREVAKMLAYAVVENVGYRQLNDVWRLVAFVDLARRRRHWGEQRRRGFGPAPVPALGLAPPLPPAVPARPEPLHTPDAVTIYRLERLVRQRAARFPERAPEWRWTLLYLRGYAGLDGRLPDPFAPLVTEVFGDLLEPAAA